MVVVVVMVRMGLLMTPQKYMSVRSVVVVVVGSSRSRRRGVGGGSRFVCLSDRGTGGVVAAVMLVVD